MSKCLSKDRNNNPCRNFGEDGGKFCKNHQYMSAYTPEMLCALQLCKGCNKMFYFEGAVKQCEKCNERGKEVRAKAKETVVLCKSDGCKYKRSVANVYCGLHQLCLFVDECAAEGVKPCVKYLKGCRTKLGPDYAFKSCQECLQKERDRDNAKRSAVSCEVVDGMKQCSVCCKSKSCADYVGSDNKETKTCSQCRDEFKKQNEKRDKEHVRELDRINSKKPERVAAKRTWTDANPEIVALKNLNHRNRSYAGSINLTKVQFDSITKHPCYYCGIMQDKGFNGIDRMDSIKGYEIDNCVSCCTECNMMKGAVDNITFIQRVEHILTHNSMIKNGNKYPDAFSNHSGSYYSKYKTSAEQRNYTFELSEDEFYSLIKGDCYICGKTSNEHHTNGVDRFDNTQGYTFHNSNACCGECNIMKKQTDYDVFMDRLQKIYENCVKKEMKPPSTRITNILHCNKMKLSYIERKAVKK
jgi:hypothetical protein